MARAQATESTRRKSAKRKKNTRKIKKRSTIRYNALLVSPDSLLTLRVQRRQSEGAEMDRQLTEHDIIEMQAFKNAVQNPSGKEPKLKEKDQSQLLHHSAEYIADKLGLSRGLIRTHDDSLSGTQKYAKSMNFFGNDDEDNPAKRQRIKREQTAQRAIATARAVIAARSEAAAASAASGETSSTSLHVSSMLSRFSSSGKQM